MQANKLANLKSVVKGLTPPYAVRAAKKIIDICTISVENDNLLFDGSDEVFKKLVSQARVYFEYGCGQSTIWVSHNTQAKIYSVDTSKEWLQNTKEKQGADNQANLQWIDCGTIGERGRPINYNQRDNFKSYILGPFGITTESPDLILVDGRFRVACFLSSLSKAKQGTSIIFDDYKDTPYYHIAEEFCPNPYFCGRQAIFTVPDIIDQELIDLEIDKFNYAFG